MLLDLALNRRQTLRQLLGCDHRLEARNRRDLRAVNRNRLSRHQRLPTAKQDEGAARPDDRVRMVLAKIGDRLERRPNPIDQPHHFEIARRLPLLAPARTHLIHVAVDIESNIRQKL